MSNTYLKTDITETKSKILEFIKNQEKPISLKVIKKEFSEVPEETITISLQMLKTSNEVYKSLKNGKAMYSTNPKHGEGCIGTQKNIQNLNIVINQKLSPEPSAEATSHISKNNLNDIKLTYKNKQKHENKHYSLLIPDYFTLEEYVDGFIAKSKDDDEFPSITLETETAYEINVDPDMCYLDDLIIAIYENTFWQQVNNLKNVASDFDFVPIEVNGKTIGKYSYHMFASQIYTYVMSVKGGIEGIKIRFSDVNADEKKLSKMADNIISKLTILNPQNTYKRLNDDKYLSDSLDVDEWCDQLRLIKNNIVLAHNNRDTALQNLIKTNIFELDEIKERIRRFYNYSVSQVDKTMVDIIDFYNKIKDKKIKGLNKIEDSIKSYVSELNEFSVDTGRGVIKVESNQCKIATKEILKNKVVKKETSTSQSSKLDKYQQLEKDMNDWYNAIEESIKQCELQIEKEQKKLDSERNKKVKELEQACDEFLSDINKQIETIKNEITNLNNEINNLSFIQFLRKKELNKQIAEKNESISKLEQDIKNKKAETTKKKNKLNEEVSEQIKNFEEKTFGSVRLKDSPLYKFIRDNNIKTDDDELKNEIEKILLYKGSYLRIIDLQQESYLLADLDTMKITRLLKELVDEGKVSKLYDRRTAYYAIETEFKSVKTLLTHRVYHVSEMKRYKELIKGDKHE